MPDDDGPHISPGAPPDVTPGKPQWRWLWLLPLGYGLGLVLARCSA